MKPTLMMLIWGMVLPITPSRIVMSSTAPDTGVVTRMASSKPLVRAAAMTSTGSMAGSRPPSGMVRKESMTDAPNASRPPQARNPPRAMV